MCCIFVGTGFSFCIDITLQLLVCSIQRIEPISHVLVNRVDRFYQIVIDSLDHLVLGLVRTDPGCCFFGQGAVQVGYVFTNGLISFNNSTILYRCVALADVIACCLIFQIFLYVGNPGIQLRIGIRTGFSFCIDITLQLLVCSIQRIEPISHVLVNRVDRFYQIVIDSLDHLVLGLVRTDPGCCFFGQGAVQVGYVFTNGLISFNNSTILYRCIGLADVIGCCLFFQIVFYVGNPGIQLRIGILTGSCFFSDVGLVSGNVGLVLVNSRLVGCNVSLVGCNVALVGSDISLIRVNLLEPFRSGADVINLFR